MQKNRTALAAGILALALVVGGFALYNNQKASKAPEVSSYTDEPSTAVSATPQDSDDAAATDDTDTTDTTTTTTDNKSTDTKTTDNKTTDTKTDTTTMTVPETHQVKEGETLRDIANRYYHNPIYSADIERLNELDNPNHITVGKVLKLPRPEELNNAPATAPKAEQTDDTSDTMPVH
ncbi:MAG TPA: LysM domain-containing protein [Symbiobacteriaceae bacterium]|nr:LysM domain-containing protein [Symbiobacteriaceae bacterium]